MGTQNSSYMIQEKFNVAVCKTLPIYTGVPHCVGSRYFNAALPLYIGEVLRRGMQNFSYIYRSKIEIT